MKKLISSLMAVMLTLTMTPKHFSADTTSPAYLEKSGQHTGVISVKGKSVDTSANEAPTYYVVVEWGSMEFNYVISGSNTWNGAERKYETATLDHWENASQADGAGTIKVTNCSNVNVTVGLACIFNSGFENLEDSFSINNKELAATEFPANPESFTTEVSLTGTLSTTDFEEQAIGSIEITITGDTGTILKADHTYD